MTRAGAALLALYTPYLALITVPGSIVNVTPLSTNAWLFKKYTFEAVHVVFEVISPSTVTTDCPKENVANAREANIIFFMRYPY